MSLRSGTTINTKEFYRKTPTETSNQFIRIIASTMMNSDDHNIASCAYEYLNTCKPHKEKSKATKAQNMGKKFDSAGWMMIYQTTIVFVPLRGCIIS